MTLSYIEIDELEALSNTESEQIFKALSILDHDLENRGLTISISIISKDEMQELNNTYRGKNKPTDVLSFSNVEGMAMPGTEHILGDIVICKDVAEEQAKALKIELWQEILVLIVHGFTHLLGFDHEKNEVEANKQKSEEEKYLTQMELDPKIALIGRKY